MQKSVLNVRGDSVQEDAPDIRSFSVLRIDGEPFEPYEPGAHIDVTSPAGLTRQYSLCGDPDHCEAHLFAVKRESASRGGSRSLHEHVQAGTELTVSAPRTLFKLDPAAREHVLIAAGVGITPLLSMAYRLVKHDAPFSLHYFARDEGLAAFLPLLSRAPFADHVTLHFGVKRAVLDMGPSARKMAAPRTALIHNGQSLKLRPELRRAGTRRPDRCDTTAGGLS
jgi:ferredoxin-NADP reductase